MEWSRDELATAPRFLESTIPQWPTLRSAGLVVIIALQLPINLQRKLLQSPVRELLVDNVRLVAL